METMVLSKVRTRLLNRKWTDETLINQGVMVFSVVHFFYPVNGQPLLMLRAANAGSRIWPSLSPGAVALDQASPLHSDRRIEDTSKL